MSTILYTHPDCLNHVTPAGHPERVDRLKAVMAALDGADFDQLDRREAPLAEEAELLRCHSAAHVAAMQAAIPSGPEPRALDADTHVMNGSMQAALRAAGGCCAASAAASVASIRSGAAPPRRVGAPRDQPRTVTASGRSSRARAAARAARQRHGGAPPPTDDAPAIEFGGGRRRAASAAVPPPCAPPPKRAVRANPRADRTRVATRGRAALLVAASVPHCPARRAASRAAHPGGPALSRARPPG